MHDWQRRFDYTAWADRTVFDALLGAGSFEGEAGVLFAHVLGAQEIWLQRLQGRDTSSLVEFEVADRAQVEERLERLPVAWLGYLADLGPAALDSEVSYRNSRGERFSSRVSDVLTHVVNHGTHHRGQLAARLRAAGHTPPVLDFIAWARTHGR